MYHSLFSSCNTSTRVSESPVLGPTQRYGVQSHIPLVARPKGFSHQLGSWGAVGCILHFRSCLRGYTSAFSDAASVSCISVACIIASGRDLAGSKMLERFAIISSSKQSNHYNARKTVLNQIANSDMQNSNVTSYQRWSTVYSKPPSRYLSNSSSMASSCGPRWTTSSPIMASAPRQLSASSMSRRSYHHSTLQATSTTIGSLPSTSSPKGSYLEATMGYFAFGTCLRKS